MSIEHYLAIWEVGADFAVAGLSFVFVYRKMKDNKKRRGL